MRPATLVACLVIVAIPGCTSPSHDETSPDAGRTSRSPDEAGGPATEVRKTLAATVRANLTAVRTGPGPTMNENNDGSCLLLLGTPSTILGGNLSVVWTAQSSTVDTLRVSVQDVRSRSVLSSSEGPSPLMLSFGALDRIEEATNLTYVVQLDLAEPVAVSYGQRVDIVLEVAYSSPPGVTLSTRDCSAI
jgi:hypothetical protein